MKVSTVLAAALFVSSAVVLPRLASAISPEHENHPRDFERRQTVYCAAKADYGCDAPDNPCCTDAQHGAYCLDGSWVIYQAPGGCEGTGAGITATFYNSNY
jgi:hypothetical protein